MLGVQLKQNWEFRSVKVAQLSRLRFLALFFLLLGLAGLIVSATISAHYLDTLPTLPNAEELRMTPRNIHGVVVYQTKEEDRKLSLIEGVSVSAFLIGLGLGLVYMRKWGIAEAIGAAEDDHMAEEINPRG